ncbi:uncharacterized protein L3040_003596 [Drepanopeziza brunnea f. sp. 'multigermtubi']|uniref:Uncharacterized protein n=1 Tax=Marssonina brunnea f. sp. multigermtubi (strain MB_m1) TaxID=1072389 RepID=K1WJF5_MARBU|nr:uncharacterized protein MBM_09386 [Drepanopeziza brunnea f. sp. 'multigermtubi' MB_m1]EKD12352.1 hypothetical protein MBM_09386 [Drepanopeziza brunnea f. sp. 'multigermtubi' MB_m1]KAJ5046351.1 hypothetical protein L3040_003596 [Drepanopeziza brunnea f. sp. 'multigermtubi']
MSSCAHGSGYMFLPPTLEFLAENFCYIASDLDIDRNLLRCRFCDLVETWAQCDIADNEGKAAITDLEAKIIETKKLLTSGKTKEDLTNILPTLKKKLSAVVWDTDMKIIDAWRPYWAVWGPGDGPEPRNEIVEEPVKEDLEIHDDEEDEEHEEHDDHNDPDFEMDFLSEKQEEEFEAKPKKVGKKGKGKKLTAPGPKPSVPNGTKKRSRVPESKPK